MYCPKCGTQNQTEARFCQNCGSLLHTDGVPLPPASKKSFLGRHKGLLIGLTFIFIFFILPIILVINVISNLSKQIGEEETSSAVISGSGKDKIALVNIDGVILEHEPAGGIGALSDEVTSARKIKKILRDISSDPKVKIVLLRVNSPGGSAAASEEIYQELLDFKKQTGKKIAVYFSDLAASGGYYVAMAGDSIVANPATITGSIGVIVSYLNFTDIAQKYGVKQIVYKSGPHKDILNEFRDPTDSEKQIIQGVVNDSYENFVKAVSIGRHIPATQVRIIGDGRIYSAKQAQQLSLIDRIGTLEDAISNAKTLAGLTNAEVVEYGKATFFESLLGTFAPHINLSLLSSQENILGSKPGIRILYLYNP